MTAYFNLSRNLLLFALFFPALLFSQQPDDKFDRNKTIVINNNKFKVYNNWLNAGAGYADDFTRFGQQFTLGVDYNFHIETQYFQAGFFLSGYNFGGYNNTNIHIAYGKRKETKHYNLAAFLGPDYSTGFKKVNGLFSPDHVYNEVGIYGQIQFTLKATYDTGICLALFGDYNQYQNMAGARLDLYFSGAYKGKERRGAGDQ
jgi:hypothetical protein